MGEKSDIDIVRGLAELVANAAAKDAEQEKIRLWQKMYAKKPERAIIYANPQNGWGELVPESTIVCKEPYFRGMERRLRHLIFRINHMPDDYPITNKFNIGVSVSSGDIGVTEKKTMPSGGSGAYHIEPSINGWDDVEQLKMPEITVNWEATRQSFERTKDAIGGILDVRQCGVDRVRVGLTRKLIHLRGLEQMYYDLYDEPKLMHHLMRFLMDVQLHEIASLEKEGALSYNTRPEVDCGSGGLAITDKEPRYEAGAKISDMLAWGESQEFSNISCEQYEEFVLQYQLPILSQFGYVDYGCCEPLDNTLDLIIKKITNMQWVAVSPWADKKKAAEKIQDKYVYTYKPNPATICKPSPDFDEARRDVREILDIAKGCAICVVMKDCTTFNNNTGTITKWIMDAKREVGA